ncbi:hypothetical protein [Nesterenkonia sp. K-15-9-6]|uniref:hypothetical protein n=1 Tax=Nesterenkonia sp. K-15-9-6 TaxID=3093918 RepID=UPI004043E1F8
MGVPHSDLVAAYVPEYARRRRRLWTPLLILGAMLFASTTDTTHLAVIGLLVAHLGVTGLIFDRPTIQGA